MVVYLDLTEEMIDSFNKCVKTGDYKPFLKENLKFLDILVDNLKYIKFEKNSKYESISKEFRCCLKLLAKFDSKNPRETVPGVKKLENNVPEVSDDIKDGITKKDWSDFYRKYRSDADYVISEARRQGIIDISIYFGLGGFPNFATRDEVVRYMNQEMVLLSPSTYVISQEFRNSGSMVQYVTEPQNLKESPKNLSVITTRSKSPYRVLQKNDNGGKTTNDCTAKTQISTGTAEGVDIYDTMPQTIPTPFKKENEKKTFFGFLTGLQRKSEKEKSTPNSDIQQNDLDERAKNLHIESPADKKQDSFSDVSSKYAADLSSINYDARNFDLPIIPTVEVRRASSNRDSPDLDNSAFEQQHNEHKLRNSRHLEEVKAERRKKQAEFEKELQKMRVDLSSGINYEDRHFPSDIIGEEESEEHSYRLADHDFENKSQKIEQVEPPEPPLNDYKEKLARLETEFQMRFKNQEEKLEDFVEKSKLQKEKYDSNLQKLELRIQKQLKAQDEQMKLREDKLRMREDELDEKVNEIRSMEKHLDMKVDEIRLREENLGRKMEEMMGMMKLVIGNTATETPSAQATGSVRDNIIDTNITDPTVLQSDLIDIIVQPPDQAAPADSVDHGPTSEDDELQQMEEQFQRAKAEQDRKNELELRNAQERRRKMNEKAEEERRRISENLQRAASFRSSLRTQK